MVVTGKYLKLCYLLYHFSPSPTGSYAFWVFVVVGVAYGIVHTNATNTVYNYKELYFGLHLLRFIRSPSSFDPNLSSSFASQYFLYSKLSWIYLFLWHFNAINLHFFVSLFLFPPFRCMWSGSNDVNVLKVIDHICCFYFKHLGVHLTSFCLQSSPPSFKLMTLVHTTCF